MLLLRDGVNPWLVLYAVNHFFQSLSTTLPIGSALHSLSVTTATLSLFSIPVHLSTLPPITHSTPFLCYMHNMYISAQNSQCPPPLHFNSSYIFSLLFSIHTTFQSQSPLCCSSSTSPVSSSVSYTSPPYSTPHTHSQSTDTACASSIKVNGPTVVTYSSTKLILRILMVAPLCHLSLIVIQLKDNHYEICGTLQTCGGVSIAF